jgi:hypothetical protein
MKTEQPGEDLADEVEICQAACGAQPDMLCHGIEQAYNLP